MTITGRIEDTKVTNTDAVIRYVLAHSKTINLALANLTDIELPENNHIHMDDQKLYLITVFLVSLTEFKKFNFYEKFIFAQHDNPDFWKALEDKHYPDVLKAIDIYLTQHPDCLDWLKSQILDFVQIYNKNETTPLIATPINEANSNEIQGLVSLVVCRILVDEAAKYGDGPIQFRDNHFSSPYRQPVRISQPRVETTYLASSMDSFWRTVSKSTSLIYEASAQVAGLVAKPVNNRL